MILEKNNARSRDGMKVFKVARYANHPRAKRHHVANILSTSTDAAVSEFMQYVTERGDYEKARYELYTGNWKECIIVFD